MTRENAVYALKQQSCFCLGHFESAITSLSAVDKVIYLALMNKEIHAIDLKVERIAHSIPMDLTFLP